MQNRQSDAERLFEGFEELETFRVQNILLVSSLYDSFILREDGTAERAADRRIPRTQSAPCSRHDACFERRGGAGLVRSQPRFNLIVTNLHVGDMDAANLAREVKNAGLDVPVVVLAYDYREIKTFVARHPVTDIDRIFLWQGTPRILIAMVKYIEDKRNVLHDTRSHGRAGHPRRRRQYSLLLLVPAGDLYRDDHPIAPRDQRRTQHGAQVAALSRPAQAFALLGL